MSMNTITKIYREKGYAETTYFCAKCGAEIAEIRDYRTEITTINWELVQYCACGERLVREVVQFVPDISESSVIEVGEEGEEK